MWSRNIEKLMLCNKNINLKYGLSKSNLEGLKETCTLPLTSVDMCHHTWKMAECSESAGRILMLCFLARGSTKGPPAISVSLLANAMSFPASMAATVG